MRRLALVAVGLLAAGCARSGGGHLSVPPGSAGVSGPAKAGQLSSIGGPWICAGTGTSTWLRSAAPVERYGAVDVAIKVHRIDQRAPTDLVGGQDGGLPASYGPVEGAEVPPCSSGQYLVFGFELRLPTARSGAVSGLWIEYAEGFGTYSATSRFSAGLCGRDGAAPWAGRADLGC